MTFAEALAALEARLGQPVEWSRVEQGQIRRTQRGILSPGRWDAAGLPVEEDGRVVFRLAPGAAWFQLDPSVFAGAQEEGDRRLRVELVGGGAFVIETRAPR
jgi:hypothetical protein